MSRSAELRETKNVLVSATIISIIIMAFSVTTLYLLTNDIYLDAYYTMETFLDNPNTGASFSLALDTFQGPSNNFWPIVGIVIIDNLSKMLVISFVLAAVLDILGFVNLEEMINKVKAKGLKGHVIVCGYNEIAENLITKMSKKGIKSIVIDENPNTAIALGKSKVLAITGKFTESELLEDAGIMDAAMVIFTSPSDIDNLLGAVTARKYNEKILIMSRVSSDEVRAKMHRVGVEMCVLPEYLAGIELGEGLAKALTRGARYGV